MALLTSTVLAQQSPDRKQLPNFHQVDAKLYRGGQPTSDGLKKLADMGIKTVVNLRGEGEGVRQEEQQARALGLRFFHVPLERMGRPRESDMKRILSVLDTSENQPVFVHCAKGVDRTGTVVAIYRITHDGWTSEQAKKEANRYGMHPWERSMKDYIHDYYREFARQKKPVTQ